MIRRALVCAFALMAPSAVSQAPVAACPEGIVCITQAQAAAIVGRFQQMEAMLRHAAELIDERDRQLTDAKARSGCT